MQRLRCKPARRAILTLLPLVLFGLFFSTIQRHAALGAEDPPNQLLLDVVINGSPIGLIGNFVMLPGGIIGATREELASLGLRTGAVEASGGIVALHDIPTLHYTYQEREQRIQITVDDAYRVTNTIDLHGGADPQRGHPQAGWGTVLNYDLFSSLSGGSNSPSLAFSGTSLTLEGRAFSPYGTLSQSAVIVVTPNTHAETLRLDSTYRYSDPDRLLTATVGDAISGGLPWTRPIRFGGVQAQSNFALRPDLVTMALPNLGGTAVVPSTVDVYVNNIRTFSEDIGAGPFNLTNIPAVTGAGNAQVVVRDSAGHETATSVPFYGSSSLLPPPLRSWSVEAGLPRLGYGSVDDQYPSTAIASATFRQGLLQWFTAEGHAEAGSDIANGGIGGAFGIGSMGVATAAVAASTGGGLQGAASFETRLLQINLDISSQHTFGNYQDLASATARQQTFTFIPVLSPFGTIEATTPAQARQLLYGTMRPPRALDRITVGGPLRFDTSSSWGLSFVHQQDVLNNVSMLASVSYSRTLPYNASLFVTAFKDFGSLGSAGVLVGLSFPLGGSTSVSANMSSDQGRPVWTTQASRTLGNEPGSVGWQVQDSEGQVPFRQASVAYRAPAMSLRLTADQIGPQLGGTFEGSGAAALMAGDVFLADRIPDAFAVVDAGAPDVAVSYENRPAGTTDSRGMLLVPTLRSYEKNHIAIDPSGLPVDDEFETDRKVVTPADRAGAMVSFAVRKNVAAALVTFVKDDHTFVPAGSHGRLQGGDAFVVGYDGQAFVRNLGPTNTVVIDLAEKPCQATFDFAAQAGKQVQIGPVTCRQ